jgi:voltage-gated sodium channel
MRGCDVYGYGEMQALCTQPMAQPAVAIIYYVSVILLATMIILNLFIGVIMNGMQEAHQEEEKRRAGAHSSVAVELHEIEEAMAELHKRIARLRKDPQQLAAPAPERIAS